MDAVISQSGLEEIVSQSVNRSNQSIESTTAIESIHNTHTHKLTQTPALQLCNGHLGFPTLASALLRGY
jgi:hypothetical protein